MELYDSIGHGYGERRKQDARIAERIAWALGSSESVVNVGAGAGSSVHHNVSRNNGGSGLSLLDGATYRANTITSNTTGPIAGSAGSASGVNLGANYCDGTGVVSASCP